MNSKDSDAPEGPVLGTAEHGKLERLLLRSAKVDVPGSASRQRVLVAGLQALEVPRRSNRGLVWAAAGIAMAAAAALAVALRAPEFRAAEVTAERMPPPGPVATPSLLPSAGRVLACSELVIARGGAPLIEDWEEKDSRVLALDGRRGNWAIYGDGTGSMTPPDRSPLFPSRVTGGRDGSRQALHLWGGRFTKWGVTFGAEIAEQACYDASSYGGLRFWAKGPGKLAIGVQMIDVQDVKYGGFCNANCYNSHRKVFELGKTWQEFSVRWEELVQLAEARPPVTLDPKRIRFLEFGIPAEATPFDVWVDDVAFLER